MRQQERIREWWNTNPMTYDWRGTNQLREGSREYFEEIDRRFYEGAFFAQAPGDELFSGLIDFSQIAGKQVLEIGCGTGAIAARLAKHGAKLTAIDLTPRAIALARKRFELFGLEGTLLNMDAENLSFPDNSFDFVWSWGVIHHSENTERIVSEIYRVLKPGGRAAIMVYHRNSIHFWINLMLIRGILTGKLLTQSMESIANTYSDGLIARYYSRGEFSGMFRRQGFAQVRTRVFGQKEEAYPTPRPIKRLLLKIIPDSITKRLIYNWGYFLFLEAKKG